MSATVANMLTHYIRTVVCSQKFGVEAMANSSPLLVSCYRGNLAVLCYSPVPTQMGWRPAVRDLPVGHPPKPIPHEKNDMRWGSFGQTLLDLGIRKLFSELERAPLMTMIDGSTGIGSRFPSTISTTTVSCTGSDPSGDTDNVATGKPEGPQGVKGCTHMLKQQS